MAGPVRGDGHVHRSTGPASLRDYPWHGQSGRPVPHFPSSWIRTIGPTCTVEVRPRPEPATLAAARRWSFCSDGESIFSNHFPRLTKRRCRCSSGAATGSSASACTTWLLLHAGVLERDGCALDPAGPMPGSGKSTSDGSAGIPRLAAAVRRVRCWRPDAPAMFAAMLKPVALKNAIDRRHPAVRSPMPAWGRSFEDPQGHRRPPGRPPDDSVARMDEPARPAWSSARAGRRAYLDTAFNPRGKETPFNGTGLQRLQLPNAGRTRIRRRRRPGSTAARLGLDLQRPGRRTRSLD